MIAAYLLTAGAVGAYLGATTLRDDVVHERVITAAPPAAAPAAGNPRPTRRSPGPSSSPVGASARTSTPPLAPPA